MGKLYNIQAFRISMLIFLPILTVVLIFLNLLGRQEESPSKLKEWRFALLQTVVIAGALMAILAARRWVYGLTAMTWNT
jgi:hypothetical protein